MQLKCTRWKTILSRCLAPLFVKKPKRSLRLWKIRRLWFNRSCAHAHSALAFQMAIYCCPLSRCFLWCHASIIRAVIIWTDALQFDLKSRLSINTIPYRDKFQDRKFTWEWKYQDFRDLAYWDHWQSSLWKCRRFYLRLPNQYHKLPSIDAFGRTRVAW